MQMGAMKVGELARRTGLTVRTLHHYDEIGLLRPSLYTDAGHRLYTTGDVARLQQVLSLRQLGFALEEIRDCLDRPGFSPLEIIRLHVARLREQIHLQRELCDRLEAIAAHFGEAEEVSADEFLQTIEVMNMIEKYYTPEQLAQLETRRKEVGEERIQQVQQEWQTLFADVKSAMDGGIDPGDARAQELARRWFGLVSEFTGGDPGIFKSLRNMYQSEENVAGMDVKAMQPMTDYIQKAAAAAGIEHPGQ